MLFYTATLLAALALATFLVNPLRGMAFVLLVKPVVDAAFLNPVIGSLRLPEIVAGAVPLLVCLHVLARQKSAKREPAPLGAFWALFAGYTVLFCGLMVMRSGLSITVDIFFRLINNVVAFYALQIFVKTDDDLKLILKTLLVAGFFPIGIGLYQIVTGKIWTYAQAEGLVRYIGLYHDAFTVRFYALQTLFAILMYVSLFEANKLRTALLSIYAALTTLVMYKAYSKSAIACILLWFVLWTVLRKKYTMLIAGGVLAVLVFGTYYATVGSQVTQLFNKEIGVVEGHTARDRSFAGRWYIWESKISDWSKGDVIAKVFGSGESGTNSHSDYVMNLIQGGIVGLLIYMLLLLAVGSKVFAAALRRRDPLTVGALMLFGMWLVDSVGLVPSAYPGYQWFVWGFVGMALKADAMRTATSVSRVESRLPRRVPARAGLERVGADVHR